MKFNGFNSPKEYITVCCNLGHEVQIVEYHRSRPTVLNLPNYLKYAVTQPDCPGANIYTRMTADAPDTLLVVTMNPRTSETSIDYAIVFSSDFDALYADPQGTDTNWLLYYWGYDSTRTIFYHPSPSKLNCSSPVKFDIHEIAFDILSGRLTRFEPLDPWRRNRLREYIDEFSEVLLNELPLSRERDMKTIWAPA